LLYDFLLRKADAILTVVALDYYGFWWSILYAHDKKLIKKISDNFVIIIIIIGCDLGATNGFQISNTGEQCSF